MTECTCGSNGFKKRGAKVLVRWGYDHSPRIHIGTDCRNALSTLQPSCAVSPAPNGSENETTLEALLLKAYNLSPEQIEEIVGVSGNTVREYYELYQQGGIEKLKEINYYKPQGELVKHIVSLEAYFRENPPASIKEAQKEIEEITGVKRSQSQVREFFKKNSISVTGK